MISKLTLRYGLLTACLLFMVTLGWGQDVKTTIDYPECTLAFSTATDGVYCNESTGAIHVRITGGTAPFTIEWAGAEDGAWNTVHQNSRSFTIADIVPGIYNIQILDEFGCYQNAEVCLKDQVSTMGLTLSPNSTACDVEGSIRVDVANSSAPYWVILEGPIEPTGFYVTSSSFTLDNLTISGEYSVTVRMGDCEQTETINVTVSEAGALALHLERATDVVNGVYTTITGGHAPYRLYYEGTTYGLSNGLTHSDGERLIQNLTPGVYTFKVIDSEMCEVRRNFRIRASGRLANINSTVNLATIDEKTMAIHQVFPNPVSNQMNFTFTAPQNETVTISVKDVLGRTIVRQQQASNTTETRTLNVSTLANGIYYLELNNGKNLATKKFIKK